MFNFAMILKGSHLWNAFSIKGLKGSWILFASFFLNVGAVFLDIALVSLFGLVMTGTGGVLAAVSGVAPAKFAVGLVESEIWLLPLSLPPSILKILCECEDSWYVTVFGSFLSTLCLDGFLTLFCWEPLFGGHFFWLSTFS